MNETYLKDYFEGRLSSDEEKMLGENIENDPEASPAEHVIASLLRGRTFAEKEMEQWTADDGCKAFDAVMAARKHKRFRYIAAGIAAAVCCLVLLVTWLADEQPTPLAATMPYASSTESIAKRTYPTASALSADAAKPETAAHDTEDACRPMRADRTKQQSHRAVAVSSSGGVAMLTDVNISEDDVRRIEERLKAVEDSMCMAQVEQMISEDRKLSELVGRLLSDARNN